MLTILLGLLLWAPQQGQVQQYLQSGLAAEQAGHYEQALGIWAGARETLPAPSLAIARQYIRLATEHRASEYYPKASQIYFWGLSGTSIEPNRDVLETEIEFLEPLAGNKQIRAWKRMADREDPELYDQLVGFWKQLDPTPLTGHNERLIEHWERIAYGREHYRRGQRTAYGTDERALVYVRYGSPDLIKKGQLLFDQGRVKSIIGNIIGFGLGKPTYSGPFVEEYVRKTREYYTFPEYEIWIYRNLLPDEPDNTIFTFGSNADTGEFRMVEAVDDFIPNRALSPAPVQLHSSPLLTSDGLDPAIRNVRPGLILQLMYYDQLASVDHFFGTRVVRLESEALAIGPVSRSLGKRKAYEHRNDLLEVRLRSPREESVYEKTMLRIPLEVGQYRMLNEDSRPYLVTLMKSEPRQALLADMNRNYASTQKEELPTKLGHYEYIHGVQILDQHGQIVKQGRYNPVMELEGEAASLTLFTVPHIAEGVRQRFALELRNWDPQSSYLVATPFPGHLRGINKKELVQPEPLNSDPNQLEMADLVLGYPSGDSTRTVVFPFTVAIDKRIPEGQALMVHAEVYHLAPGPDGVARFELSYQIKPKNFLGWTKERADQLSLTLHQEVDADRWAEDLQIQTRKLDPGAYVLRMQVTDTHNGRQVAREVHFTVVEQ